MDEKKLEEMYELVRQNNSMLKSARRSAFVGGIVKAVWWILILIVLPYFTWIYLQPYLDTIMGQYQTIQDKTGAMTVQAQGIQSQLGGFTDLLKQFGIGGAPTK